MMGPTKQVSTRYGDVAYEDGSFLLIDFPLIPDPLLTGICWNWCCERIDKTTGETVKHIAGCEHCIHAEVDE